MALQQGHVHWERGGGGGGFRGGEGDGNEKYLNACTEEEPYHVRVKPISTK